MLESLLMVVRSYVITKSFVPFPSFLGQIRCTSCQQNIR